jgi:hypothetical protein
LGSYPRLLLAAAGKKVEGQRGHCKNLFHS